VNDKMTHSQLLAVNEQFRLPNICTMQSLLFAVLAGILLSVVFALVSGKNLQSFDWLQFALIALFVLWVVLLSVALLCRLRPYLVRLSLLQGAVSSYLIILAVTLLVSLVAQWVMTEYLGRRVGFDAWLALEHVLVAAILAGVSLRYLYLQEQLHVQQQAELSSRIQALQSRIRPHFLFNSMNIIASLIETEPALAERVVEDLSTLFRATLSDANQLVPLEQEIALAKNYLHIEALRLGERLKVEWHVDSFEQGVVLPHLSLQPLLENAIYHGIQPLPQGGTIVVQIFHRDTRLEMRISNPVSAEFSRTGPEGNRLALENFRHRLQAYYGNQAQFSAEKNGSQFEVTLSCPLTPTPPARA
jgi:two-component system sensor histidine kinase AlgZ